MGLFTKNRPTFNLHVLIYEEDNIWVAHCLEMDILTADKKQSKVEKDIIDLINAQILSAVEHDNIENILKPAPPEDWAKLYYASKTCNVKKLKDHSPFKGVELCLA